jgi:hypothetical protein
MVLIAKFVRRVMCIGLFYQRYKKEDAYFILWN